jgi:hypothetical protein
MRRFIKSKRGLILLATLVVAAAAAVGAYAYFTTTGSGNGTASVGTNSPLTIVQSGSVTGLTPDGGAQSVAYTINNPTADGAQSLGVVSISNITVDPTHVGAGCMASWFSSTAAASPVGTIAAGGTYTSVAGTEPTIQLNNVASDQSSCEGATLSFDLNAVQGS